MNQQINNLGGFLSNFPIDLNKASQDEKLNYIATLVYGMAKDVTHLQDDLVVLRQGAETMKRDGANTRLLTIIALLMAAFAIVLAVLALVT